jgi:hypothetical protein
MIVTHQADLVLARLEVVKAQRVVRRRNRASEHILSLLLLT